MKVNPFFFDSFTCFIPADIRRLSDCFSAAARRARHYLRPIDARAYWDALNLQV